MVRDLLNVAWAISFGAAVFAGILLIGAQFPGGSGAYATMAFAGGVIAVVGLAVHELERRAFKRGQLDAEEKLRKDGQP